MTTQGSTDTRTRAERLFHEWLELSRVGTAPERESFVQSQDEEVRPELERMLGDYDRLREELGDGNVAYEVGRQIGDFRLIRELGRGGMGVVWEAEQVSIKRKVALKLLFPHHGFSEKSLKRFHREAEAGGRLAHQGIVQVYAVGEADGLHYMAQELVPGGYTLADSLADLREESEVPEGYYRSVAELFIRVADALAHAHELGVIHRDIKPSNILIAENDQPKLADFGMARVEDQLSLSRTGEFMGTPYYMSPEQVASKRMGLDHRTDIFSLGATLYEALTLTRSFDGDTSQQVFQKILTEDPPDPRELRSRVPRDLAVIALKALEKSPENRFQTMTELAEDLRRFLRDEPIRAKPPGIVQRVRKWIVRHPTWTVIFGLGGSALITITVLLIEFVQATQLAERQNIELEAKQGELEKQKADLVVARDEALRQTKIAEQSASDLKRARDLAIARGQIADQTAEELRWQRTYLDNVRSASYHLERGNTAEARQRLLACPDAYRGWEWRHLMLRLDRSKVRMQTPAAGSGELPILDDIFQVGLSPDGAYAFSRSVGATRVWDAETGLHLRDSPRVGQPMDALAYTSGGRLIAAGNDRELTYVWDAVTGESLATLEGHTANVNVVRFGADASRAITASSDDTARVWDVATGAAVATLVGHERRVLDAAISPDGRHAATCSSDRTVRLWDVSTGTEVARFETADVPRSLTLAPDGLGVASESQDGTLEVWHEGRAEPVVVLFDRKSYPMIFGPDGARCYLALPDGTVEARSARTGEALLSFAGPESGIRSLAVDPAEQNLVGGADGEIFLWNARTGEELVRLPGHDRLVGGVAFSADGRSFITGAGDGTVRIWDTRTRNEYTTLRKPDVEVEPNERGVQPVVFSPDGRWVAAGERERSSWTWAGKGIRVWDARTGEQIAQLRGHEQQVSALVVSPDGLVLVSGSLDGTVRVWDVASGAQMARLEGFAGGVKGVAYDARNRRIAACGVDRLVKLWNARTFEPLAPLELEGEGLGCLVFAPDGRRLYGGGLDGVVRAWDPSTGAEVARLEGHEGPVVSVAVSPDGRWLATGGSDGTIRTWEAAYASERNVLTAYQRRAGYSPLLFTVAYSPDGSRIVSGSMGGTVRVWDAQRGEELAVLYGPAPDRTFALWDPETGRQLQAPSARERHCAGVTFSPDGKRIASAHSDGSVRIWESDLDQARGLWAGEAVREQARALMAARDTAGKSSEELFVALSASSSMSPELRRAAENEIERRREQVLEQGVEPLVRGLFLRKR